MFTHLPISEEPTSSSFVTLPSIRNCPRTVVTSKGLMNLKTSDQFRSRYLIQQAITMQRSIIKEKEEHRFIRTIISSHLGTASKHCCGYQNDRKQQPPTQKQCDNKKQRLQARERQTKTRTPKLCTNDAMQCNTTHLQVSLIDTDTKSGSHNEKKKKEKRRKRTCKSTS